MQVNAANGLKSLMIGAHAKHFVGWGEGKGRLFLEDLLARTITPEIIYRHEWQNGDLILWDNRCTLHRATEYDELNARRDLQRTTVSDEINSVERREMESNSRAYSTGQIQRNHEGR